jgi:hypothetical protein
MVSAKAVRQALYTKLNVSGVTSSLASGSASIHHSVVPSSGAYPLVVFNEQASTVTNAFTGEHFDSQVWLVKAIVKGGSSSVAEDVDKAIADALHFQPLNITGGDDMYLARESAVTFSEVVAGEVYRHHGHLYRLIYQ